jgi:hypothetical protein
MANRLPAGAIFPALTPVALRAPSVSAGKTSSGKAEKTPKTLTDVDH